MLATMLKLGKRNKKDSLNHKVSMVSFLTTANVRKKLENLRKTAFCLQAGLERDQLDWLTAWNFILITPVSDLCQNDISHNKNTYFFYKNRENVY